MLSAFRQQPFIQVAILYLICICNPALQNPAENKKREPDQRPDSLLFKPLSLSALSTSLTPPRQTGFNPLFGVYGVYLIRTRRPLRAVDRGRHRWAFELGRPVVTEVLVGLGHYSEVQNAEALAGGSVPRWYPEGKTSVVPQVQQR